MPLEDENLLKKAEEEQAAAAAQQQQAGTPPDNETPPNDETPPAAATPPNGQDVNEWPDDVPRDQEGKRPSDRQDTIDFDELPEHLREPWKRRFNSLYKQTKAQDRHLNQLSQDFGNVQAFVEEQRTAAEAKDRQLADIKATVDNLRSESEEGAERVREENLRLELAKANEEMNFTRISELTEELTEVKAQKLFRKAEAERQAAAAEAAAQQQQLQQPQIQAPEQEAPQSNIQPTEQGGLSVTQQYQVQEWANETGADGQYLRPWAANPQHPMYRYAFNTAATIMEHPTGRQADLQQVLDAVEIQVNKEIRKLQGGQQQQQQQQAAQPGPAPLQANRDHRTTPAKNEIRLSDYQKATAERMFYQLSPKEAHAKYLAGLKATQKQ